MNLIETIEKYDGGLDLKATDGNEPSREMRITKKQKKTEYNEKTF